MNIYLEQLRDYYLTQAQIARDAKEAHRYIEAANKIRLKIMGMENKPS